jgi:hypothetical protein
MRHTAPVDEQFQGKQDPKALQKLRARGYVSLAGLSRAMTDIVNSHCRLWRRTMTVLEIMCGRKSVTPLEIVWRNPQSPHSPPRRHSCERDGKHTHYLLQEFVDDGCCGYWTTISAFEVVVGGHAA